MTAKKIESHAGWSRWDDHLRFNPNSRSTDSNSQQVMFCSPRRHRRCMKEGKCRDPNLCEDSLRDQFLEEHGVKPKSRSYLSMGDRTKGENAAIARDWREVDKIRKRLLKDCRPIQVEVTER